jgi:hypothetical protein
MRSGLIKIRRGLYEFGWGLRDYAIVGIKAYRKKTDIRGIEELQDLEWEQQELERERQEQLELKELEKLEQEAVSEPESEIMQESEQIVEKIVEEPNSPQQAESKEGEGL